MHIMYLTPEEQRVAIYEAVKTNDMSSLDPEAVRTYHIKDSWFKSPDICYRSSPAANIRRKAVGLFSCLSEKDVTTISHASLPDEFREVCELCMGYERDGGKLMLTDITDKELAYAYMFRYKNGDGLAHPLLFYPVSVTWTLNEIIAAGVLGYGDVIQTGTVRISKEDGTAWFRMRGNGMRCLLNALDIERWKDFCITWNAEILTLWPKSNSQHIICIYIAGNTMAKKKFRITEKDFLLANRKASREEEIARHGKLITFRTTMQKSKKVYDRKRLKKAGIEDDLPFLHFIQVFL